MKFGEVGGIIAAASKKDAVPLLQIGSISIIKRIVLILQRAGVFPIVVVTGTDEVEVTHQLASLGVIFLRHEQCDAPELFSSVKLGLSYLKDKCEKVVFTPVNTPMFSPETLKELLAHEGRVVRPSCLGKGGHPVVIDNNVIPEILSYTGDDGLRGAIRTIGGECRVEVDDEGVLMSIHDQEQLNNHLKKHNHSMLNPGIKISIDKESVIFEHRLKLLLLLIADMQSVKRACKMTGLAYGNAWIMLNRLEQEVGYTIIERKHGGSRGGHTILTEKGRELIQAYQLFEMKMRQCSQEAFDEFFKKKGLM